MISQSEYRFFVYSAPNSGNATFLAFDNITSIECRETPQYAKTQERTHLVTMSNGDRFDLTEDQFRALMGAFRRTRGTPPRRRNLMKNQRQLTIIETPYAPSAHRSLEQNLLYLRDCLRDSWNRGELPFASHAFFPLFLRESDEEDRIAGIEAGYQFWNMMPQDSYGNNLAGHTLPSIAFYLDHGMSPGMQRALDRAKIEIGEVGISRRYLNPTPTTLGRPSTHQTKRNPSTD